MKKQKQKELGPHEEAKRAFDKLRKQMDALAPEDLVRTNVDIGRAAGIAIAAEPKISKLLPELEDLPGFEVADVHELREVALAALYAHTASRPIEDASEVTRLAAEALPARYALRIQAEALADRGLLSRDAIDAIGTGKGHREVAEALLSLAHLFTDAEEAIGGQTPVKRDELEHAANLGTQLILALGAREVSPHGIDEDEGAKDTRARAFTLLAKRYEKLRRAVTYVRWYEGDAREIAPSLYGARHRRRANTEIAEVEPQPAPATAPAPTDG